MLETFDFDLAEMLGMTVAQLHTMPNSEYVQWRALMVYRAAQKELEG